MSNLPALAVTRLIVNGKTVDVIGPVAVVGQNYWTAKRGLDLLKSEWDEGPHANLTSAALAESLRSAQGTPINGSLTGDLVILEGSSAPDHAAANAMPSFGAAYTDAEIAAVANHAIANFGGKQGQVTAKNVAAARP